MHPTRAISSRCFSRSLLGSVLVVFSLLLLSASSFPVVVVNNRVASTASCSGSIKLNKNKAVQSVTCLDLSDWSDFQALDDDDYDDEILGKVDTADYAVEEDSQEYKAQVGAEMAGPSIERPAEPIQVPAGSQLELTEETVLGVLSAMRAELGTLFGYTAENRGVGITGGVDFVELDGPTVIIKIKGRFWHQRTTVLDRVANYLQQRIPEIVEVTVDDPWTLTDEANEVDF